MCREEEEHIEIDMLCWGSGHEPSRLPTTLYSSLRLQGSVQVGDGVPIRVAFGLYEQLQIKAITRLHWHELVCHPCLCARSVK